MIIMYRQACSEIDIHMKLITCLFMLLMMSQRTSLVKREDYRKLIFKKSFSTYVITIKFLFFIANRKYYYFFSIVNSILCGSENILTTLSVFIGHLLKLLLWMRPYSFTTFLSTSQDHKSISPESRVKTTAAVQQILIKLLQYVDNC